MCNYRGTSAGLQALNPKTCATQSSQKTQSTSTFSDNPRSIKEECRIQAPSQLFSIAEAQRCTKPESSICVRRAWKRSDAWCEGPGHPARRRFTYRVQVALSNCLSDCCSVMEDPEARRARLKAMREQAEGASQSASVSDNHTGKLANPFEEVAPISDASTPRFNYYSNPAAGFVHTKRKEPLHVPSGPRPQWRPKFNPPAPVPPPPMVPQVGGFGSPIPLYHPQQGFPPALEPPQRPGEMTWPIKRANYGPGRGAGRSRGSGPGRGGSQAGNQARGQGGGSVSARDRPDLFYQKSMVEDPWRHLLS